MKSLAIVLAFAGALMLAGCGGGGSKTASMMPDGGGTPAPGGGGVGGTPPTPTTPAPEPTLTFNQLPTRIADFNEQQTWEAGNVPATSQSCSDLSACQTLVRSRVQSATELSGQRFQGTGTVQTDAGATVPVRYWGTWFDDFMVMLEAGTGQERWFRITAMAGSSTAGTASARAPVVLSHGSSSQSPFVGTYTGTSFDSRGNWGTSELTYTHPVGGTDYVDATVRINNRTLNWRRVPMTSGTGFESSGTGLFAPGVTVSGGAVHIVGSFYGDRVGACYHYSVDFENLDQENWQNDASIVIGGFGARYTRTSTPRNPENDDHTLPASWQAHLPGYDILLRRFDVDPEDDGVGDFNWKRDLEVTRRNNPEGYIPGGQQCDGGTIESCRTFLKARLGNIGLGNGQIDDSTSRFQGSTTGETDSYVTVPVNYWGGWIAESGEEEPTAFFLTESIAIPDPSSPSVTHWFRQVVMGRSNSNPFAGTYSGDAVDIFGNWGTATLNYVKPAGSTGNVGLTVNIPAHGEMVWPNMAVDDRGRFEFGDDSSWWFQSGSIGPEHVEGRFTPGDGVAGHFVYRKTSAPVSPSRGFVFGAFGAKRTTE